MPDWARDVRARLSSLRLSPTREREIVEELSQHLDDRWHELIAGGLASDEAARLTLAEFTGDTSWPGTWRRCGKRARRRQPRQEPLADAC